MCGFSALLLAFAFPVLAEERPKTQETEKTESSEPAADTPEVVAAKLDHDQKQVRDRVGIAALMEVDPDAGPDLVAEGVRSGYIIEVTLEEVEAALASAAATPDPEDDKRALDLRHRGSYRFFSPSTASAAVEGSRKTGESK